MNEIRDRAKKHFPMVLLTLLSIVQALALELLWSHVRDTDYLFELSMASITSWLQIFGTFLGLVLIWVVYASNAMRFRWVPATSDSVYPFLIGITEFVLIESLGPDEAGLWLIATALAFGLMTGVSHETMRRAREDDDNGVFFDQYAPATLRDFTPHIASVALLMLAGITVLMGGGGTTFVLCAVLVTIALLGWQFYSAASFWKQTVVDTPDP